MRKAQSKLQKIQDVKTRDQKEDYEFLRHKVTQVVGDEAAADEVLKEAIIQNVKENCQDGINVFVGDEKADDATIKMNNMPNVEVENQEKIDVDVYPGNVHKPKVKLKGQKKV